MARPYVYDTVYPCSNDHFTIIIIANCHVEYRVIQSTQAHGYPQQYVCVSMYYIITCENHDIRYHTGMISSYE